MIQDDRHCIFKNHTFCETNNQLIHDTTMRVMRQPMDLLTKNRFIVPVTSRLLLGLTNIHHQIWKSKTTKRATWLSNPGATTCCAGFTHTRSPCPFLDNDHPPPCDGGQRWGFPPSVQLEIGSRPSAHIPRELRRDAYIPRPWPMADSRA